VKIGGVALQGYRREDLWDSWTRYLPPSQSPEPAEPPEPRWSGHAPAVPLAVEVPEPAAQPEPETPPLTCGVPQVPEVPDSGGEQPPPAWTPAREPLGACFACAEPSLTVNEVGQPCHIGCGP